MRFTITLLCGLVVKDMQVIANGKHMRKKHSRHRWSDCTNRCVVGPKELVVCFGQRNGEDMLSGLENRVCIFYSVSPRFTDLCLFLHVSVPCRIYIFLSCPSGTETNHLLHGIMHMQWPGATKCRNECMPSANGRNVQLFLNLRIQCPGSNYVSVTQLKSDLC